MHTNKLSDNAQYMLVFYSLICCMFYVFQGGHDGAAPPIAGFMPSSSSSMSSTTGSVWNEQGASRQGPVRHHWFYLRSQENYWIPFSLTDSASLENAVMSCPDVSQQVCSFVLGLRAALCLPNWNLLFTIQFRNHQV